MSNAQNGKYDLEERTALFGETIIDLVKGCPKNVITIPIINQIVKSGISVGCNYAEADCAESRKDFEHKFGICKKEAKETKHLLRMLSRAEPSLSEKAGSLRGEANELKLIFIAIINKSKFNSDYK
jgi:four helix bundle protein